MRNLWSLLLCITLVATNGCVASGIRYDPAQAGRGMIDTLVPQRFEVKDFVDGREDKNRVGVARAFGLNVRNIESPTSVTDAVTQGLRGALTHSGHIVESGAPLIVTGEVQRFWFELQNYTLATEVIATIDVKLRIARAEDGKLVYERDYHGCYKSASAVRDRAFNEALARMIESVLLDPDLVAALKAEAPTAQTSPAATVSQRLQEAPRKRD